MNSSDKVNSLRDRIDYTPTQIIMFSGNMDAICYGKILRASLLPFIQQCHPRGHCLYQDNDTKHTSNYISNFSKQNLMALYGG